MATKKVTGITKFVRRVLSDHYRPGDSFTTNQFLRVLEAQYEDGFEDHQIEAALHRLARHEELERTGIRGQFTFSIPLSGSAAPPTDVEVIDNLLNAISKAIPTLKFTRNLLVRIHEAQENRDG